MKNDITIKDASLLTVIEDRSLGELIKPLINEIHLFDTFIAWTAHIKDQSVYDNLHPGEKLILRREDNRFDERAILILNSENIKLGYIPKKDNVVFSRLMDAGKLLSAKVISIDAKEYFIKVRIGIYLVDY